MRDVIVSIKKGFTLIELLVVISIIAVLMAILMPALTKVRDLAKVSVCSSSLRQLTYGWILYSDDNNGKLVNAMTWTPMVYQNDYKTLKTVEDQIEDIKTGALFKYLGDSVDVFKCPTQNKNIMRSYNIAHSMNGGSPRFDATEPTASICKKTTEIRKTATRFVFIDEYHVSWGPWTQYYSEEKWWNQPAVQHSDGTTFSFADGHCEKWKWKDSRTLELGSMSFKEYSPDPFIIPKEPAPGSEDLHKVQRAMWGNLGYNSSSH